MSTVILDDCLQNLLYAQETMKEWIPMTEYEIIFEASEKSKAAENVAKNEEVSSKAIGFVRKAINAVIGLIKKIYQAVKDLIDRCTMSGDEREAFNQFREAMKNDPSLKDKKVSVADFRKIKAHYDDLLSEIDKNIRAVKNDETHPIDGIVKKVTDFTKGTVSSVAVIVAADTAIKMANSNVDAAKILKDALRHEEGIMEELSKALGKREATKFKKQIDAAAKNTLLHRLKVSLFKHQYNSLRDSIDGTIKTLTHAGFKDVKEVKDAKKDLKAEKKSGTISNEDYKKQKAELDAAEKKARMERRDSLKMDSRLLKNDYTGKIIKTAVKDTIKTGKIALDAKRELKKEERMKKRDKWIEDHITDKDRKKRDKKGEYKSGWDFFTK